MNTVELIQYAVKNALDIMEQVTADLTQEQCDWAPPGLANPIGATYWHAISGADFVVHGWGTGRPPLSQTAGWEENVVLFQEPHPEGGHGANLQTLRIGLAAMREYTQAVTGAVNGWLASLTPEDLERTIDTPIGPLNLAQVLETFVAWHINAHCGEISALKGCQGFRGYPF
jgi:hypothetical protein